MTETITASAAETTPVESGHGGGLARVLGPAGAVLLVLSCITPASSLFIIVPEMMASQGSGVVLTILAGILTQERPTHTM